MNSLFGISPNKFIILHRFINEAKVTGLLYIF